MFLQLGKSMQVIEKYSRIWRVSALLLLISACSSEDVSDRYVGYVEAEWVYVAAPQSGWLISPSVEEGSTLVSGEVLFQLDTDQQVGQLAEAVARTSQAAAQAKDIDSGARPAEINALLAQQQQAEARLVLAESERDRVAPLVAKGVLSNNRGDQAVAEFEASLAAVDAAKEAVNVAMLAGREQAQLGAAAAYESAQATQTVAQWRLEQRTVHTLIDARVEQVFQRQGEFVNAGSPVVALLPSNGLKVRFFMPQAKLPSLTVGQSIEVFSDGSSMPLTANISYISAVAEFTPPVIYSAEVRDKLVFMVEASLPSNTELNPGLPVDVSLQ